MKIFMISFVFGLVQILILRFLIWAVTKRNGLLVLPAFVAKFALYGYGIYLLMFKYLKNISYCAFGYIIGMVLTAFVLFIFTAFLRKD